MPGAPAVPKKQQKEVAKKVVPRVHKRIEWNDMEFNRAVFGSCMKLKKEALYSLPTPPKRPDGTPYTWEEAFKLDPKKTFKLLKGAVKKQSKLFQFGRILDFRERHTAPTDPFHLNIPNVLLSKLNTVGNITTADWQWTEDENRAHEANTEFVRVLKASNILLNFMLKNAKAGTSISLITSKVQVLIGKLKANNPLLRGRM